MCGIVESPIVCSRNHCLHRMTSNAVVRLGMRVDTQSELVVTEEESGWKEGGKSVSLIFWPRI